MKVLVASGFFHGAFIQDLQTRVPDLQVSFDFSDILALANASALERLCVAVEALWEPQHNIDGWEIGLRVHSIDASIPILVFNGNRTEAMQHPANEVYVDAGPMTYEEQLRIAEMFFKGLLQEKDCVRGFKATNAGNVFSDGRQT